MMVHEWGSGGGVWDMRCGVWVKGLTAEPRVAIIARVRVSRQSLPSSMSCRSFRPMLVGPCGCGATPLSGKDGPAWYGVRGLVAWV